MRTIKSNTTMQEKDRQTKDISQMDRTSIVNRIGNEYHTANVENGEYSYIQASGSKKNLIKALDGHIPKHYRIDLRFQAGDTVILVETKQEAADSDEDQLREYLLAERTLHYGNKIICIMANTINDKIKVWKSEIDREHFLS